VGQVANLPFFRQVGNLPHERRWIGIRGGWNIVDRSAPRRAAH
jgi:hypothetical protein